MDGFGWRVCVFRLLYILNMYEDENGKPLRKQVEKYTDMHVKTKSNVLNSFSW